MDTKRSARKKRHTRVRAKVFGVKARPRLSVFRSSKHIYAQIIDDESGATLVSASSLEIGDSEGTKKEKALEVGKLLAKKAGKAKVKAVVFDRGGYMYHGRVEALAQGAREGGLKF